MTVSSTSSRLEYTGNGVTVAFSVTFQFLTSTDLKVYQAGTLKTISTHYTVTGGNGATGTVTFVTAPANAEDVVIVNDPPMTQTTDYVANDPFPAEAHERALDKLTILIQRLKSQVDRALVLSDTTVTGSDFTLPAPDALKALRWNAAGDAIENTTYNIDDYAADASVSAAAAAVSAADALASESAASISAGAANVSASAAASSAAAAEAIAIEWAFDTGTTMADPGTGDIRFNNATVNLVTNIAVSALSAQTLNPDVSAFVAAWADSTNTKKGIISLRQGGDSSVYATFYVTAVTDNSTWLQLAVTHIGSAGNWAAADRTFVAFSPAGDAGVDGTGAGDFMADGTVPMTGDLLISSGVNIVFEGSTVDAYETTLTSADTTGSDKTITLPNATGVVLLDSNIGATVQAYDADTAKLDVAQTFTAVQTFGDAARGSETSLTSSAASVAVNLANSNFFTHTFTENTTLANPTNIVAGQEGIIVFTQHASSPKTLAFGTYYKFPGGTVPTITATNSAVDVMAYYVVSSTFIACKFLQDVK